MISVKVSIIMPTYNVGDVVSDTIESVLKQTYIDWELIIVDDCSSDNTIEVIKSYIAKYSNIKLFINDINRGAGISRNIAINKANGQYLAFLDSDDLWFPEKLMKQITYMEKNNLPISHTSFNFIDNVGENRVGGVLASEKVNLIDNLKNTEIGTSTAIIDKFLVTEPIFFCEQRARQDLKLWIKLLGLGYSSYGINEVLVSYRVRKNSVSSNKIKMLWITWNVYKNINTITRTKRVICFINYFFNAIKKRV